MHKTAWKRRVILVSLGAVLLIGALGVRTVTAPTAHASVIDGSGCVQTDGTSSSNGHGSPKIWHTSICVSGGPNTYYVRGNCWVDQYWIPDAITTYYVQCNLYHWVNGWAWVQAFNASRECIWIAGTPSSCGGGSGAGASSYQYSTTTNQLWEADFATYNNSSRVEADFTGGVAGTWYVPSSAVSTDIVI